MVGFVPSVLAVLALSGPPALPEGGDAAPADGAEPTAEGTPKRTEPESEPAETVPAPQPEVTPEPEPEPAPAAASPPVVAPAYDAEAPPLEARPSRMPRRDDEDPVERFEAGQWGMQFTFGGLAPMSIGGVRDVDANRLAFTELGFRRVVSDRLVIPFSVGAGVFSHAPSDADSNTQNDVGLAASVGIQRYFRVWRRIAPFGGGVLRLSYSEPNGRANWMVGIGVGPVLGIEYFVGHRVSLSLQGNALVGVGVFNGLRQIEAATQIDAGGQMGLTFYF